MSSRRRALKLAAQAERDLEDILGHSLVTWGVRQMDVYHAAIDRALDELLDFPAMGRQREDLGPGYRERRVEQHVIYYRVEADTVRVQRILHVRRDVRRELLE